MIDLDTCLQQIISRLVVNVSHQGKLQSFRTTFEKRKIYDEREKAYIENQKIKLQLGAEYDSEESDLDDQFEEFGSLSKYEMKCMLKQNLIKNKFDENKLSYIEPPTPQEEPSDRDYAEKQDLQSINRKVDVKNELKVITQKKTSNILGQKNFEALDFVIQQLEKVVNS